MNRLVLPSRMFDSLAEGRGGPAAGRFLASAARGRHLVLLKGVADEASSESVHESFRALAAMYDASPGRVDRVLRHPSVGAWALAALRSLRASEPTQSEQARPEGMAAVAAAAAVHAGVSFDARVPMEDGIVMLPSLGRALLDEPFGRADCQVRVSPAAAWVIGRYSQVRVPADVRQDVDGWDGMRMIGAEQSKGGVELLIDDLDPYRFPLNGESAPRLSVAQTDWLQVLFRNAWAILWSHHRGIAEEVRTMISVLTPISTKGWLTSGTSRTTFGCVALTSPPDAPTLALVLAHEIQHAKLTVLFHLMDLVLVDSEEQYYAPWRRDLRPITGLLHGTYAHLGVAAFWRRQRHLEDDDAAHAEFLRWRDAAAETAEVLRSSSALTPLGHRFTEGMLRTLRAFQADSAPARAHELAREAAEGHRNSFGSRSAGLGGSSSAPRG